MARLRARGHLAELRAAELRFTTEEAGVLLREAVGPDPAVPDASVDALATRTEGWAAGLQLAALSLKGRSDVAGFVETFSGGHRYVLDYLAEEVLDRQPEPVRAFLLETSLLERLSGPLCDAVCGRTDSEAMLERVERANLFLVPLDSAGSSRPNGAIRPLLAASRSATLAGCCEPSSTTPHRAARPRGAPGGRPGPGRAAERA